MILVRKTKRKRTRKHNVHQKETGHEQNNNDKQTNKHPATFCPKDILCQNVELFCVRLPSVSGENIVLVLFRLNEQQPSAFALLLI